MQAAGGGAEASRGGGERSGGGGEASARKGRAGAGASSGWVASGGGVRRRRHVLSYPEPNHFRHDPSWHAAICHCARLHRPPTSTSPALHVATAPSPMHGGGFSALPGAAPGRDRRESPAQAQVAEQAAFRGRDHRAPCESLDEARKAHARHVKLGVDRSLRHARPLLAACALAADWPGSMAYAASIFAALDDPEAFDYNTLTRDYSASPAAAAPAAALSLACHRRLRVTRRGRRCSVPCLPPMRERKSEREERGRVGGK
uniref:Uncharacterized protein n=1 Tax=Oryza rufipogon TaxID=4529 RepID=A0A0E0MVB4_ORYRU